MDRRQFCVHGLTFVSAATLLQGCGGSSTSPSSSANALPTVSGAVAGNVVTVNVDAGGPLGSTGGAASVSTNSGKFLAFRMDATTFNVMTAICTHEQCNIDGISGQTFVCPCHGSQYNSTGTVVKGPATRSLQRFNSSFANNVLTFTI